jgi:CRP/FNR family transcriptional regulator, cyclic AMP receptor protein
MDSKSDRTAKISQFLGRVPMFAGISKRNLETLAGESRIKLAPRGTFMFFRGDPANAVFVILDGAVVIHIENMDGRELVINEVGIGDCFGELGILTGEPHSANAEAMVDSEVVVIPESTFKFILEREPSLALRLLEITALRLQNSSRREEALAFHDARQRLAYLLLHLDQLASERGYLAFSQEDYAQRTGLTRQTVATILGDWRRRGWLLTGRGYLVVLNRKELNQLIQGMEIVTDL